ncbi:hypothetical protein [Pseudomonas arsenicoxydans]|uniref:Uncharacterized protein n=1 Tax=Pseudomonas arsenicoxydans TaxID=702115 RepID=A0A502GZF4_9PSED|nr:hypothetical protein [Pseudomonas arsenicoxydans]TPG67757.1 hypothetical protein EAH78_29340 [Pseudomonas arsenicoxydans]
MFDGDDETNTSGIGSGNVRGPIPGGSFFVGHQLDNQWLSGLRPLAMSAWRNATTTMGADWRLAAGLAYTLDKVTDLNFSWVTVWKGDRPVDRQKSLSGDRASGEFDNTWIQDLKILSADNRECFQGGYQGHDQRTAG